MICHVQISNTVQVLFLVLCPSTGQMIFHAAVLMLLDAWFIMYLSIITGQMAYNADIRNFSCTVAIIKHSIYDMLLLDVSTVLN